MAFDLIAVRQAKAFTLDGQGTTVNLTFDAAVAAGSALLVIGTSVRQDTGQTVLLSSVSGGGTWSAAVNVRSSGDYSPNAFYSLAPNVSAGSPTVALTMNQSASVRTSGVLFEVEKAVTSSVVDKDETGTSAVGATSTSTSATGALTQTDNLVVLCAGGYLGIPQNPSGYTSYLSQQNGAYLGCQVSAKKVTATTTQTGTVNHDAGQGAAAMMVVLKAATTSAKRYKATLRSDTFTSADTNLTMWVYRNGDPDVVLAEKYTGLTGSSTAGLVYVTAGHPGGLPADLDNADVCYGLVENTADTSGCWVPIVVEDA